MSSDARHPSLRELRQFGLIMAGMIVLMAGLVLPWLWGSEQWWVWPFPTAGLFALAALTLPAALAPIHRAWMGFALVMGWINSRIILGLSFYLIIFPVGLLMRILGKDPLMRRFDANASSYRVIRQPRSAEHLRKPF